MNKEKREPRALNKVAEFHQLFDLPVLDSPSIPDEARCQLRVNLLTEELEELREGIQQRSLVEIADALADLQYVLSGAILEFGLSTQFAQIFDEVHRSNMSKACNNMEEAQATQRVYQEKGIESEVKKKGEEFLVLRIGDQKVLKSVNYSEAKIGEILK